MQLPHIRLLNQFFTAFRSFTDLNRDHSLFSLATPSADNNFLIFKKAANGLFELWARGKLNTVEGIAYKLNTWHSICSTWNATSGLMQLWVDGVPSSRKFTSSGSNINGPIIIVLGQVPLQSTTHRKLLLYLQTNRH